MKPWPKKLLGELCDVIAGGTPNRGRPDFFGGDIPWVKIGDMLQGTVFDTEENISQLGLENSAAKILPAGTTLISIFATVGRTAVLRINAATNQAIAGIIPKATHQLTSPFLRRFLDHSISDLTASARGGAQLNINGKILKSLAVPVPPLAEQKRLVKILDEADTLRKLRTQADRRTVELIPALFHEMFGAITETNALGSIASVNSGVAKGRQFNGKVPMRVPYLRVANVQDGRLDLTELKTIDALPNEIEELSLRIGDVVMTEGGDFNKLGRGAMLDRDLPGCIYQNHIFRVRCDQSRLLPEYFASFLLSASARSYFMRCAKKTSNLASINMTQLRALPVPAATLQLQQKFAERVREIREMEAAQARSRAGLDALFASLLDKAFKGQL
jgi:type I restriction enzyme S subunit